MNTSRLWRTCALALALTVSTVLALPTAAIAAPASTETVASAPAVNWSWRWSDGSLEHRQSFSRSVYGSAVNLPYLIVENDACASGILIKLQFRENGRYLTEDHVYTKGCKAARLHFNPYTESGRWAIGVYKERLMIPGLAYHYFTIEYTR